MNFKILEVKAYSFSGNKITEFNENRNIKILQKLTDIKSLNN